MTKNEETKQKCLHGSMNKMCGIFPDFVFKYATDFHIYYYNIKKETFHRTMLRTNKKGKKCFIIDSYHVNFDELRDVCSETNNI